MYIIYTNRIYAVLNGFLGQPFWGILRPCQEPVIVEKCWSTFVRGRHGIDIWLCMKNYINPYINPGRIMGFVWYMGLINGFDIWESLGPWFFWNLMFPSSNGLFTEGTQLSDKPGQNIHLAIGGVKQSILMALKKRGDPSESEVRYFREIRIKITIFLGEISHFQERRALRAWWPRGGALWAARGGLLAAPKGWRERFELVGKWWICGDCVVVSGDFVEILWVGGWPAFFFCAKIPLWWWNIALTDEMWRWVKIWNFEQIAFGQLFCPGNKHICFLNVHFIVSINLDSIFVGFFKTFFLSPHLSLILVGYPILVGFPLVSRLGSFPQLAQLAELGRQLQSDAATDEKCPKTQDECSRDSMVVG